MSISGSLASALSGINANARSAEIVSSNIANAMTPGYGRREIILMSRQIGLSGQGVTVVGTRRHADMALISDRRVATATAGNYRVQSNFLQRLERVLGSPEDEQSLNGRLAAFDSAMIAASSRPESESRQAQVVDAAKALTGLLASASSDIQSARSSADDRIESSVQQLNSALARVGELNRMIRLNANTGRDGSALLDQRQQLIDSISAIVPVREIPREYGQVALMTTEGAMLLDGQPAKLEFTPVGVMTHDMTLASGALSGLTLLGKPIATVGPNSPIAGGTLAADFLVRDQIAPDAQTKLDGIAREIIERFAANGLDATRAPGDPGLFTDSGVAFNPVNEAGLSQRLQLNAAVDPDAGGDLWRLRDGLGAVASGPVGNAQLLIDWQSALTSVQNPASAAFNPGNRSLSGLTSEVLSGFAADRLTADGEASYATARADSLQEMELAGGVDTDKEIQTLLLIEQNYAANAKVVATIDEMIQLLLGI